MHSSTTIIVVVVVAIASLIAPTSAAALGTCSTGYACFSTKSDQSFCSPGRCDLANALVTCPTGWDCHKVAMPGHAADPKVCPNGYGCHFVDASVPSAISFCDVNSCPNNWTNGMCGGKPWYTCVKMSATAGVGSAANGGGGGVSNDVVFATVLPSVVVVVIVVALVLLRRSKKGGESATLLQ